MIRTEARDESGFTLIELVMSLTVLSIAIFGIATVFTAAIRTASVDTHRTAAVDLASQWSQEMSALPYASLDMGTTAFTDPSCDSQPNEVLDGATPLANPLLSTTGVKVTYTGTRCAMWGPDATNRHYKRTAVVVKWTDAAGVHSVRQDSAVYDVTPAYPPARTAADLSDDHSGSGFSSFSCALGTLSVTDVGGIPQPAVERNASTLQLKTGVTVKLSANIIGAACQLWLVYFPNSASSGAPIPLVNVSTPPAWSVTLPTTTDSWDLGPHILLVQDGGGLPVAQATVCVFNDPVPTC